MTEYGIERDADLRGFWVKGLKEVSDYARKHTLVADDEIFIPDSLVRCLNDCGKAFKIQRRL